MITNDQKFVMVANILGFRGKLEYDIRLDVKHIVGVMFVGSRGAKSVEGGNKFSLA